MKGKRYDDDSYILDYRNFGIYPKIHDDIFFLFSENVPRGTFVLDIGGSIGMLSTRLQDAGYNAVMIEPTKAADKCPSDKVFCYYTMIKAATLPVVDFILKNHKIEYVIARRVISELFLTGGSDLILELEKLFIKNGVKAIILEGRLPTSRATCPIPNTAAEVALFNNYKLTNTHKRCAMLTLS